MLLYRRGSNINFGSLGLKTLSNNLPACRFAVVIPKKVVKSIVRRNRLRRVIFDEIGKNEPKTKPGRDIIVRLFKEPDSEKTLRELVKKGINQC